MIQTLDLPVLSLAIPNIHKLNDINTDNLSCMWTVFSKCKDNLENGRRLENMSWRLWYREATIKESKNNNDTTHLSSACPIPIQLSSSSNKVVCKSTEKHLSPASFKRIISSLNENEAIVPHTPFIKEIEVPITPKPNMILFQQPHQQQQQQQQQQQTREQTSDTIKFFIKEDEDSDVDYEDEDGWSSEEDEQEPTPKNLNVITTTKKFMISDEDEDEDEDDDDHYEDINEEDDGEAAFLSEFRKRSPIDVITKNQGCSLLSNMLRAQNATRLVSQPINVVQNQKFAGNDDNNIIEPEELSTSMRKCVEWEQQQHDFILNSNSNPNLFTMTDDNFRTYW